MKINPPLQYRCAKPFFSVQTKSSLANVSTSSSSFLRSQLQHPRMISNISQFNLIQNDKRRCMSTYTSFLPESHIQHEFNTLQPQQLERGIQMLQTAKHIDVLKSSIAQELQRWRNDINPSIAEQQRDALYHDLLHAGRMECIEAKLTSLDAELLFESYEKTFILHSDSDPSDKLRIIFHWTNQRNKYLTSGICKYHARITIQRMKIKSIQQDDHDLNIPNHVTDAQYFVLDINESQSHIYSVALNELLSALQTSKPDFSAVTKQDLIWFLGFITCHPSDHANSLIHNGLTQHFFKQNQQQSK